MRTAREARRDAHEYARAQMFYGEGAGNRRKLIEATVEGKALRDPAYSRVFHQELSRQDMAEHASKARKEREHLDRSERLSKNVRGIMSGNYQSVSTGVMIVGTVVYFAHQTGYDKVVIDKTKQKIEDVKAWNKRRKAKHAVVRIVKDA